MQLTGPLPAFMANATQVQFMKIRGNSVSLCPIKSADNLAMLQAFVKKTGLLCCLTWLISYQHMGLRKAVQFLPSTN